MSHLKSVLVFFVLLVLLSSSFAPSFSWSDGGYTKPGNVPAFGTHDWLASFAASWLPASESWWIKDNLYNYLLGTELPDNAGYPLLGIGDTSLHHVYYHASDVLQDDAGAQRAGSEYNLALGFFNTGNYSAAALHAGIMSHYITDLAVFGHVMGAGTDWGTEVHHSDYEDYVETRTNEFPTDDFSVYMSFSGTLVIKDAYNASLTLAYDTTFGGISGLSCIWMDTHYNWTDTTFTNRAGQSLNLSANLLADVLHNVYVSAVPQSKIYSFPAAFEHNTVRMIYPSDQFGKPLVLGPAMLSDWTASGLVYTKLQNVSEGEDTNPVFINQTNGKPLGNSGIGLITFGGPDVNLMTYYAETQDNAPVHFIIGTDRFYFRLRNGSSITGADLLKTVLDSQDMFVIEVFKDNDGRYQMILQGFGWKGSYAAGKYFNEVMYPSVSTYNNSWIIVKWQDTNGDGFVNAPSGGDTYTIVATG